MPLHYLDSVDISNGPLKAIACLKIAHASFDKSRFILLININNIYQRQYNYGYAEDYVYLPEPFLSLL